MPKDPLEMDMSGGEEEDDSLVALPLPASASRMAVAARSPDDSGVLPVAGDCVAVDVAPPERAKIDGVLRGLGIPTAHVMVEGAVLVVDAERNVRAQLEQLRAKMRADAAIILVAHAPSPEMLREAHDAGAVGVLRAPIVPEEVASLVKTLLETQAVKTQLADVTRRLDLETHLASIGRLSAGLAHEISTPLTTLAVCVDGLRERIDELGVRDDLIDESLDALGETRARLQGIVAMIRKSTIASHEVVLEAIDLREMLETTRKVLAGELEGVDLSIIGDRVLARADRTILAQILQNLIANAAQAAKTLASPRVRLHAYVAGDCAVVSVRDNGPGIAPKMHATIFEPFYTTRRARGGTGLGLALCREYAVRIRAELSLWSAPGRGACFRVALPHERR